MSDVDTRTSIRGASSSPVTPTWLTRVRIPKTATDWELYQDMPGAEEAAGDLSGSLQEAARLIDEALRGVEKRLSKYSDFGALDTEPRSVARQALSRIIEQALGACL